MLSLTLLAGMQAGPAFFQDTQLSESILDVNVPPTTEPVSLAISPDGDKIIFVAEVQGKYQLWLHSLTSGATRPLPGTDDVLLPFPCWSPDSRSIAYTSNGDLKRMDIESGRIRVLTSAPFGRG